MNIEKQEYGWSVRLAPSSEPMMSEARVAADIVGSYWDHLTTGGDLQETRMLVRDLHRSGVRTMQDAFRDATQQCEVERLVPLSGEQVRFLGAAASYFCDSLHMNEEPYEVVARQVASTFLLKLEEAEG